MWSYSSLSEKLLPHVQVSENVLALAETLYNNQMTLNSSLSLVLMLEAQCNSLWSLSTAFIWLESERAFYNPDLGSSCILSLIWLSDIKASGQPATIFCNDYNQWNYLEGETSEVLFLLRFLLLFSHLMCLTVQCVPFTASLPVIFGILRFSPYSDEPHINW